MVYVVPGDGKGASDFAIKAIISVIASAVRTHLRNLLLLFGFAMHMRVTAEDTAGVRPVCTHSENGATRVETAGRKRGVTPICCNDTQSLVVLIVCQIRMERRGEDCSLLYRDGRDFENKCDSKFRLVTQSQTVFLQWNSLTPEDHGNITCECSNLNGTFILYLNFSVDGAGEDLDDLDSNLQQPSSDLY
ncbi:uncharacterized protein LOC121506414 isoform X2 [Cheilinus undulatus]|uniref:uncharacterized protein LOC121506414 isoform X2 n=1 Tax=Cheilinus undulatus TaxID=241271 RepID=UPI001BD3C39C|nr:uncharacterized protein LOC121506414 isoform X2 [Cheilinus undulatus]